MPDAAHHPTHINITNIIIILNAEWHCHVCLAGKLLDLASADPCRTHVHYTARRGATGEPYQDLFCISVTETCWRFLQPINTVATPGQLQAISDLLSVHMLRIVG